MMPVNRGSHISAVVEEVKHLSPNSVLDVGVGFGMMGVMFRAYTDIRLSELDSGRYHNWETKIDGIEIFERYQSPAWKVYDRVFIGDAFDVIPKLSRTYDMAYAGDILEHFEKERGHDFIRLILTKANVLIIATPSPAPPQNALLGNETEEHKSSWDEADFVGHKHEVVGRFDGILVVKIFK